MKKFFLILSILCGVFEFIKGEIYAVHQINSIAQFKLENPGVELIELAAYDHELDLSRTYSLGQRQTGDVVIANAHDKKSWNSPQNVTTTLTYPSNGQLGGFITYIIVNCEQSSQLGHAYVTRGGTGTHFVQIVIETNVTKYFNYSALFYGFPNKKKSTNEITRD